MADVLKLTFLTTDHKQTNLRVPYPYRNLTDTQVKQAMSKIIGGDTILITGASLSGRIGAEMETITEIPYIV